jgi:hypothetical protein
MKGHKVKLIFLVFAMRDSDDEERGFPVRRIGTEGLQNAVTGALPGN